ncbi:hypothetical protein [Streptomyces sp. NPDC057616]|uniref:hypothetical protein n=1 Tax=Streptomyces sp. NPDC057616 TaxID=3346183 RepID=UPI003691623F
MSKRTWIASAGAIAALLMAAVLYADALRTGHTDGGLRADPRDLTSGAPDRTCTGTRPLGSLSGHGDGSALARVVAHIDELARTKYPDVRTSLSADEAHRTADVWRVPSAAFDDEVCGDAVRGVTVRLHDTGPGGESR